MQNLKAEVVAALKTLTDSVYFFYPPQEAKPPFIVYHEIQNDPEFAADDAELTSKIGFGISVFCQGSTSVLAGEVNRVMAGIGFYRDMCVDGEPENGANVKHMRFITEREEMN